MSILGSIFSKIFPHHDVPATGSNPSAIPSQPQLTPVSGEDPAPPVTGATATSGSPSPNPSPSPAAAQSAPVDIAAMLDGLESKSGQTFDWRHSIVDMMKLLGLDSALSSRQALAKELHYTGDMHDSATMNIWLHQQVMTKLAENGGTVPADLRA